MAHIFEVENIHCDHCAKRITSAIVAVAPGAEVTVDVAKGRVEVDRAADRGAVVQAIEKSGYKVKHAA